MKTGHNPNLGSMRRLHKRLGLVAGIGMLWLAVTGLAIVWSDNLNLPRTTVPGWIARIYGSTPTVVRLVSSDGHVLEYNGHWQFDGHALQVSLHAPSLLLAGPVNLYYAIADNGVALIAGDGTLVDSVSAATLGQQQLSRAGGNAQLLCAGDVTLRCTSDSAVWKAGNKLPPLLNVAPASSAPSMERLLLDLHAGRFLSPAQKILWTLLALALMLLPWSGLRLALRKRPHPAHGNRKYNHPSSGDTQHKTEHRE